MTEAPSVEQLAALINFSVDAVLLVDTGGVIGWANPVTARVLGFGPGDLNGLRVRDLVEPRDQGAWQDLMRERFAHPEAAQSGTFRCRHRDGTDRAASLTRQLSRVSASHHRRAS